MPFQSEAQRRYLWANEPKIARDWADTYGSRIEKNDGGITNPRLLPHTGADLLVRNTATGERPRYQPPGKHGQGQKSSDRGGHQKTQAAGKSYEAAKAHSHPKASGKGSGHYTDQWQKNALKQFANLSSTTSGPTISSKEEPIVKKQLKDRFNEWTNAHDLKRRKDWTLKYMKKNPAPFYKQTGEGFIWDDWTDEDFLSDTNLQALKGTGYLNTGNMNQGGGGGGYRGYPSYAAWLAAQGKGGTTEVAEVIEEPISDFQKSLTGTVGTPGYYVGNDPTASNLAWGKQFGADPRTMGQTSWAANGGRIPAAFGGIMDSSTGRRAYGFGSIFKSIGKAAKKVLKSPIGRAALIGGLGFGANAGWFSKMGLGNMGKGWVGGLKEAAQNKDWLGKLLLNKDENFSPWKLGIAGLTAAPFLMGDQEEDEGSKFDYDAAKNAYRDELMRIKSGAMAGSLDPNQFNYLGVKDGGRIGLYSGGQSTPSDYTMEDARKTSMQDKMGGVTETMKRADLYRQGDVGQMYMAHGGSADDKLMARVQELQDEGLDYNSAMAQALKELSSGKAQGGRIGADEGGLMDLGGMEKDYRNDGGFVPLGGEEKADDVPARLSKNEFVFTADAVRGAGDGDIDKGAEIMENIMKNLEQGGQISEETQGLSGAQEMFGVSERLSEVV